MRVFTLSAPFVMMDDRTCIGSEAGSYLRLIDLCISLNSRPVLTFSTSLVMMEDRT